MYQSQGLPGTLKTKLRPLKRAVVDLFKSKLATRAENPYATHVPVLVGLSRLLRVRRVLEFGCGEFSTLTFLDKTIFTELETLVSYENDALWKDKMALKVKHDPRVHLEFVPHQISEIIDRVSLTGFDMIFVDDSVTGEQRADTIRKLTSKLPEAITVVIHDYEYTPYRKAVQSASPQYRLEALNPNTGVIWNHQEISRRRLKELNALIKRYSETVAPNDVQQWRKIFTRET